MADDETTHPGKNSSSRNSSAENSFSIVSSSPEGQQPPCPPVAAAAADNARSSQQGGKRRIRLPPSGRKILRLSSRHKAFRLLRRGSPFRKRERRRSSSPFVPTFSGGSVPSRDSFVPGSLQDFLLSSRFFSRSGWPLSSIQS